MHCASKEGSMLLGLMSFHILTEKPNSYSHVRRMKMVISVNVKQQEKNKDIKKEVVGCKGKIIQSSEVQYLS